MKQPISLAGVAAGCLVALAPVCAGAQAVVEAQLTGQSPGSALSVTARLPQGWAHHEQPGLVAFVHPDAGGRQVIVALGPWARGVLTDRRGWGPDPIERAPGRIGGLSARVYIGQTPDFGQFAQFLNQMVVGSVVLVHLDGCQGPGQDPAVLHILGGEGAAVLSDDPLLAGLADGLTLALGEGAAACPADLAQALGAVDAAVAGDGWTRRDRYGLTFWLPADFGWSEGITSAQAIHPDFGAPDGAGFFGVRISREYDRDDWRREIPSGAEVTERSAVTLGGAGSFDGASVTFFQQGMRVNSTVLTALNPGADSTYVRVNMVAIGAEANKPWLGLTELHDQILDRLGAP